MVGSVELPAYDAAGVGIDCQLGQGTYVGLTGLRTGTDFERTTGLLDYDSSRLPGQRTLVSGTAEKIDYIEHQAGLLVNRILAAEWFAELAYRFTRSEMENTFPQLARPGEAPPGTDQWADLHEVRGALLYRRTRGFFARAEAGYYIQEGRQALRGIFGAAEAHRDRTFQLNLFAGWEFPRRQAEITIGLLNVTGDDYRFSALNPLTELPRDRTLYMRLRLNF